MDLFENQTFLKHSNVCPDEFVFAAANGFEDLFSLSLLPQPVPSRYVEKLHQKDTEKE